MAGIFYKYDITLAKQRTLLYAGVRNYLIDKERSECRKINPISENSSIYEDFSFFDTVDDKISERIADISRYLDMLESVQEELEVIEFKEHGKKVIVEGMGELFFSAYVVMYLRMIGYNFVEMAELFGLSSSYIRMVYKKAVDLIRETFNIEAVLEIDSSDIKEDRVADIYTTVGEDELYGTPVLSIRFKHRRKFVLFCKGIEKKRTLKAMYIELNIGDCTAVEWKKKFIKYFHDKVDVQDTLNRWLMIVK